MGTIKNSATFKGAKAVINSQGMAKVTDFSFTDSIDTVGPVGDCSLIPYDSYEVGRTINGSLTFGQLSPTLLATIRGTTVVTSGSHAVQDEALTAAALVTFANTPVVSGTVQITALNGAKWYKYVDSTPAVGEWSYFNDGGSISGVKFNGSEADTTIKATYAYLTTGAERYDASTAASPKVRLVVIGCGTNLESGNPAAITYEFPSVKFTNFNDTVGTGAEKTVSLDFDVVLPVDGSAPYSVSVEDL